MDFHRETQHLVILHGISVPLAQRTPPKCDWPELSNLMTLDWTPQSKFRPVHSESHCKNWETVINMEKLHLYKAVDGVMHLAWRV